MKSKVYFTKNLKAGDIITHDDIFPVRPIQRDGFYPYEIDSVIGKKILHDVMADTPVLRGDIEDA